MLHQGIPVPHVLAAAPTTSAGAAVVTDGSGYTPAAELFRLSQTACGTMIVDAGAVNMVLAVQLSLQPVVVLVGRADIVGAEAACAAVGFLSHYTNIRPVVVLSSPAPVDQRRVNAARKLVATTGVAHLVHLPFDARLAASTAMRLDRVGKTTASACLRLVSAIAQTQEVLGYVR